MEVTEAQVRPGECVNTRSGQHEVASRFGGGVGFDQAVASFGVVTSFDCQPPRVDCDLGYQGMVG